jgi:8-oxo-dGTP pyrophosphatase MutT (NUDIX family)
MWQIYDRQGRPVSGKGVHFEKGYKKAILHAAAHVWIWRQTTAGPEILVQKRAAKHWHGRYDISAAGHVDLGEEPLAAAIRETEEELGHTVQPDELQFFATLYAYLPAPDKSWTDHEYRFLYLLEIQGDAKFSLTDGEVTSLQWKSLAGLQREVTDPKTAKKYIPHGDAYFALLVEAVQRAAKA